MNDVFQTKKHKSKKKVCEAAKKKLKANKIEDSIMQ